MTVVVKVGGAVGNSVSNVVTELAGRTDTVLVHGGSEEIDRLAGALGQPAQYYTSPSGVVSRRSDPAHLEVAVLALAGKVQTALVAEFARHHARAVGLSGVDDRLLLARRKEGAREVVDGRVLRVQDDLSGTIENVNTTLLRLLLSAGITPVVGPPAISDSGELLNVDADRVAAKVAVALRADALVLLTNVPGLLRDPDEPTSVISRVERDHFDGALALAKGRMRKKLLAARAAKDGGVGTSVIAPSAGPAPVDAALRGAGTVVE